MRNDADTTRAHFVTATFRFGFDVKLSDVKGCNGVSFELRFSNAQYVRYSGYSGGDFGERGIVVIDRSDVSTGDGRLHIGVLSGNPAGSAGKDDPIAIRLDFVVTPDAPHGNVSTFSFVSAKAVVNSDSGSVIDLRSDNVALAIRSYIDIWPGDANNDGKVNTNDISTIGSFLTNSDNQGPYRGFKRQPASTYWTPQTALAWDSVLATSADCDGSGEVTLNDILVVQLNFYRERTITKITPDETQSLSPYINPKPMQIPLTAVKIPVFCNVDRPFIGAAARIAWNESNDNSRILGIEPSEAFSGDILCYSRVNNEQQFADIAIGTINAGKKVPDTYQVIEPSDRFILCYLIVDSLRSDVFPLQMLQHPTGITASGQFFPIKTAPLSVDKTEGGAPFSAKECNGKIIVETDRPQTLSVTLYNVLGEKIGAPQIVNCTSSSTEISLPPILSGAYYASVAVAGKTKTIPIIK